jgi:hypothetical protein
MSASLEFFLGLFECDVPPRVTWEDITGPHGEALRLLQQMGIIATEPGMNPIRSCPFCEDGVPYLNNGRFLCNHCHSTVDRNHLLLWPVDLHAFLHWLAVPLKLTPAVRPLDGHLWHLGSGEQGGQRAEWFYYRSGALTDAEKGRLSAYRQAVVLYGLSRPPDEIHGSQFMSLLEVLKLDGALTAADSHGLRKSDHAVRFDPSSGALWLGNLLLGEVPGSRPFYAQGAWRGGLSVAVGRGFEWEWRWEEARVAIRRR